MKKIYLAFTLVIIPIISFGQENLVQNPSFEAWDNFADNPDEWGRWGSGFWSQSTDVTDGTYSLAMETACNPDCSLKFSFIFNSAINLEAGKTYEVSLDYKVLSGTFSSLEIEIWRSVFDITEQTTTDIDSTWKTFSMDYTPTTNETIDLYIRAFSDNENEVLLIDNVKLVEKEVALTDKEALIAIYNATDGPNWTNPWDLNADISTWEGVILNAENRVEELWLYSSLNGTLPSAIKYLTDLKILYLFGNTNLTGNIPPEIGELIKLEVIDFRSSKFSGTIPPEIGKLKSLRKVNLSSNNLDGPLPVEIGELTNLQSLDLSRNNFTGELPASVTNLTLLESLDLTANELTGNLPPNIGNMVSLKQFTIGSNNFSGEIPSGIGLLTNLEWLQAASNEFTGTIPSELGNLLNATIIDLGRNNLTGTIPESFVNLTNLERIQVGDNNLSGVIPEFIWDMTSLTTLDIGGNDFTGVIPPEIGNLTSLNYLFLNGIDIMGTLPSELWSLTNLITLDISDLPNLDQWSIPDNISNLVSLGRLYINNSNLSGEIPDVLDSFTNLTYLELESNNLTGAIPPSFSSLTNLYSVSLNNNKLSGELPILNSLSVRYFYIQSNNFVFEDLQSNITDYINNITSFQYTPQSKIDAEEELVMDEGSDYSITITGTSSPDNVYQWRKNGVDIEGENGSSISFSNLTPSDSGVYDCLITNPKVPNLNLERNKVTLKIYSEADRNALIAFYNATDGPNWTNTWDLNQPINTWYGVSLNSENRVTDIYLRDNNLSGTIPESIKDLALLEYLGLEKNNLTGNIPDGIGSLTNLTRLHLSSNNLTGNIPESFGNLTNLDYLYLSYNNLEGNIPEAIGSLTNLTRLLLQRNNLQGSIPESIGNLTNLTSLGLETNNFNGNIPEFIGNLTNLTYLTLGTNNLDGNIPDFIGNLTNLTYLNLSNNNFEGNIPESIGNLTNLRQLYLENNTLEGNVPLSIGNLSNLSELRLSYNNLKGKIPEAIGSFTELSSLSISVNNFVFEDIESLAQIVDEAVSFTYANQQNIDEPSTVSANVGDDILIQVEETGSSNNQYQWYKDNDIIEGATDRSYHIPSVRTTNNGIYTCKITNTLLPDLTLSKNPITLKVTGDDDNDGIENGIDECPQTPLGEIVNEKGCSQSDVLGNSPVQVMGINTSCPNTNNGEIIIDANNNVSNQIVVSGPNYNETFSGLSGSENVILTDLAPGIYNVCVTYEGYEANYCSSVNIEETEELTSSKAQVDLQNQKASFYVSGSKHYEVLVNNILYKYSVNYKTTTKIEVPLESGINEVVLKTDKTCQGEKRQTINFAGLTFYPNPAEDYLNIVGLNDFTDIEVYITDLAGNRITSQVLDKSSSSLRIPLYNLSVGVYIVNIKTDTQTMNTKIYKK